MNFTLKEIFDDVPDELSGVEFPSHLATDSRDVIEGGAFVALEGERTDGHKYISQAVENGAALVIVRKGKRPDGLKIPVIELENPERDLADAASRKLKSHKLTDIIAITGSVGKTTTRAALQKILEPRFKVHAPQRNFNTLIGCTATIMAMPKETEVLVLEFGANKPGEIRELTEFFPPSIAILTAVAPVHLEGFGSVEGVFREKLEITHSTNLRKIIFNNDNEYLSETFKLYVRSMGVGENKDADFVISHDTSDYNLPMMSFVLAHRQTQEIARFTVSIWGRHNALPLSLASAAAHELNISLQESADSLRDFQALKGRGRVVILEDGKKFLVDDAYNANPASMSASVSTFAKVKCPQKVAVLGEMRELGENEVMYHSELEPLLEGIDTVILVGRIWREAMKGDFIFVDTWQEALAKIPEYKGLLVKGSNSIGLSNIVKEFAK